MKTRLDTLRPRKLLIFSYVFDLCSSTAAAEAIGITQPAVSKSILQLERDLGTDLFERTAHGFKPLAAAKVLRRRLRWIDRELGLALSEIADATLMVGETLTIGAGPVWSVRFLPQILPGFHQCHPSVRLDILTGSGDYFVSRFLDGVIDVYFGMIHKELQAPNITCIDLMTMKLQAFARKDHPVFATGACPLDFLSSYNWIGFSHDQSLDQVIAEWCGTRGIQHRELSMTMMSVAAMMSVAKSTDIIVFAVDALSESMRQNGLVAIQGAEQVADVRSGVAVRGSLAKARPIEDLVQMARNVTAG